MRRLLSGSRCVALDAAVPRPLGVEGSSCSARCIAAAYGFLRRVLAAGPAGHAMRAAAAGLRYSALGQGGWLRLLGVVPLGFLTGSLLGGMGTSYDFLGGGRMSSTAGCVALALLAFALALAGPTIGRAFRGSLLVRAVGAGGGLVVRPVGGNRCGPASLSGWRERRSRLAGTGGGTLAFLALAAIAGVAGGLESSSNGGLLSLGLGFVAVVGVFALYRPEVLLLFFAAFPWLDWVARRALAGSALGAGWDELLLIGSVAALLFCLLITGRWNPSTVPLSLPLAVAVVAAVGSVTWNDVPGPIALFALRIAFQPLLVFYLAFLLPKDRRWLGWTIALFLAASLLLALHGLYQYVTHAPMPAKWIDTHEQGIVTRAYSVIENPNGLGAFLLMGSLLAIRLSLARVALWQRVLAGSAGLVLLAGLAVTFSRGAWLGLAAGLVVLGLLGERRLLGAGVLAALMSPVLLPRPFLNRLLFAFSAAYIAKSLAAGRLFIWKVAVDKILEHPLVGVGLGTFGGTSAYLFGYSRFWVDNAYLQLAAEGGLILLLAFLWMLVRAGKGVAAAHRGQTDPFLRGLSAGVLAGLAAVAVANLTASVWETLVVGYAFWFLAGLAGSLPAEGQLPARLPAARNLVAGEDGEAGPLAALIAGPESSRRQEPASGGGARPEDRR